MASRTRKTYKQIADFADGVPRAVQGVFVRLSRNQVEQLDELARIAGLNLEHHLRSMVESILEKMVPAEAPESTH